MKKVILIFLLVLFITVPLISLAEGLVPCGGKDNPCQLCDLFVLFSNIVNFFLIRIIPALAVLMIAIGGFFYIFSRADPEMLSRSKSIFTSVVYGLLIIYGAWVIVNLFFQVIGVTDWTGLKNGWWKVNCSSSSSSLNDKNISNIGMIDIFKE